MFQNFVAAPLLAAADWLEIVGALAFLIITGLAQLLQKRARERQGLPPEDAEGEELPRPPASTRDTGLPAPAEERVPPVVPDWEAQLRRLFEPPGRAQPDEEGPPVLVPSTSASAPPRPDRGWSGDTEGPSLPPPMPAMESRTTVESEGPQGPLLAGARIDVASRLAAAARAFRRASNLDQLAANRLQAAQQRALTHTVSRTGHGRPLSRNALLRDLLKDRQSVRQAIIASCLLQGPKALE